MSDNLEEETSPPVEPHSIHDFSIHYHKVIENNPLSSLLPIQIKKENEEDSRESQGKCKNGYMADTCCGVKRWTTEEVDNVISLEQNFFQKSTIVIKLPDKKVNKQILTKINQNIHGISFIHAPFARRCVVTLKDATEREKMLRILNSSRFGTGFLSADGNYDEVIPSSDEVDPFTLYLDEIPMEIGKQELISLFPNSQQISVGYSRKRYYTKRYAFIIYSTIDDAIKSFFKTNKNTDTIVRFRRFSGSVQLLNEKQVKKHQDVESYQKGLPIVIDAGPPVLPKDRAYKVIQSVTIKAECSEKQEEIVLDDDDDDNEKDKNRIDLATDFDVFYENLKQARIEMDILRQME